MSVKAGGSKDKAAAASSVDPRSRSKMKRLGLEAKEKKLQAKVARMRAETRRMKEEKSAAEAKLEIMESESARIRQENQLAVGEIIDLQRFVDYTLYAFLCGGANGGS